MKKTSTKNYTMHQKSDSLNFDRESQNNKSFQAKSLSISPLNLNTLATNATNDVESGLDTSSQKQYKVQHSRLNYENLYNKLAVSVKEMFLEMKTKLIRDVSLLFPLFSQFFPGSQLRSIDQEISPF